MKLKMSRKIFLLIMLSYSCFSWAVSFDFSIPKKKSLTVIIGKGHSFWLSIDGIESGAELKRMISYQFAPPIGSLPLLSDPTKMLLFKQQYRRDEFKDEDCLFNGEKVKKLYLGLKSKN